MLPGGSLSKHGYTKRWGFFSGVCPGAGHQPFELSKDAIEPAIANVRRVIAEVEAEIDALENLDSEVNAKPVAWHHTYKRYGYVWEQVPVVDFASKAYDSGTLYSASVQVTEVSPDKIHRNRIEAYGAAWKLSSLRHWVHFLNEKYAKHLRAQNGGRRDWVRWQEDRLKNWAPKPLTPR
jgi:hypothetical protein